MVDEGSVGVSKPSAFADKFMQEQLFQQQQFQQQQQLEQVCVSLFLTFNVPIALSLSLLSVSLPPP